MKRYCNVTKTYEKQELVKCTCDKCGAKCEIEDNGLSKYSDIQIIPRWAIERSEYFQLCPTCSIKLLKFFNKAEKKTNELKEDMEIWLED